MRARDIWQLALLRARSRAGRRTAVTMALGLVLLIPVVGLLLGIYAQVYSPAAEKKSDRIFSYYTMPDDLYVYGEMGADVMTGGAIRESEAREFLGDTGITSLVVNYNSFVKGLLSFKVDGKEYGESLDYTVPLTMKAVEEYLPIIDECVQGEVIIGDGFSQNTAEIYIAEPLLETLGLDAGVLGKRASISLNFDGAAIFDMTNIADNDTVYDNPHIMTEKGEEYALTGEVRIFTDFEIAGIISKEYYGLNNVTAKDAYIWIKRDSFVMPGGEVNIPKYSVQQIYTSNGDKKTGYVFTYPSADYVNYSLECARQGRALFFTAGTENFFYPADSDLDGLSSFPQTVTFVQYDDFASALGMHKMYDDKFGEHNLHVYSQSLDKTAETISVVDMICAALGTLGIISLVTCIVNYSGAAAFNLRKRKNFLDMMEKMGITAKDRQKLILFETLAIVCRALAVSAIITAAAAVVVVLIFATLLSWAMEYLIWLVYLLPAYLICAAVLTLIMLLIFAYIGVGAEGAKVKNRHKQS